MIIDSLENMQRYAHLGARLQAAFAYLKDTDFGTMQPGRYVVDGENIFAMISEYETRNAAEEKLEAHRRYIDIQYMVSGSERMGYALLNGRQPSVPYQEEEDYMLFDTAPAFFLEVNEGMFTVFYPTDLHMPCIMAGTPARIKKVVMKIHV